MRLARRFRSNRTVAPRPEPTADAPTQAAPAGDATGPPIGRRIESLSAKYRRERDPLVAARLVALRHEAFAEMPREPAPVWPPSYPDPFPEVSGRPPEIEAAELTSDMLGGAIRHHGCLLVRGLFSSDLVALLRTDLDEAFKARAALAAGETEKKAPYYRPFRSLPGYPHVGGQRKWIEECGGVWVADSPPALSDVIEAFRTTSVSQVVGEYLGEPPALSVNKCTLRRVGAESFPSWHQDGAFLGDGVRAIDVWVSLTECGEDTNAPGLGIAPRRFDHLLPTATEGAIIQHSIGKPEVVRALDGLEIVHPHFRPGDALIFDELFVHCTGMQPGLTGQREALETWFFTPSTFPPTYAPLAL